MSKTIKIYEGKLVRDPYGSYDDCSPGVYLEETDTSNLIYIGPYIPEYLDEYNIGDNIKITIE